METKLEIGLAFLLGFGIVCQALTLSSYVTSADKERYKARLLAPVGDDLAVLEKTAVGLSVLGVALPEPEKICKAVKQKLKKDNVESLYYAVFLTKKLADSGAKCDVSLAEAEATFNEAIKTAANTQAILHSTAGLSFLGRQIDSAKVTAALDAAIKADDSPLSIAYALKAASFLKGDLKKYHDLIEDVIAQSDEIDDKYAQFEGGFTVTAKVIDAAYKLSHAAGLAPTVTEDKVVKFANYFLSRKHTESKEEIAYLLEVFQSLTTNKFHVPVAVSLASSVSVSEKSPLVAVRVTDLLGNNLGKLTVTADTARHLGDDAVVLSKKPFTTSASDASLFELELMKAKPVFGFYLITISVVQQQQQKDSKEPKLLGTTGAEVEVKVVIQAAVESVDITVADKEQNSVTKSTKVQHPNKIALEADYHQRLTLRFVVLDKLAGKAIVAHQTFVRLTNVKTKQEVIFVAEEDTAQAYKFELDVGAKAKDFNSLSGKYSLDLIVGDAVIENPIMWTLSDIQLTFHDEVTPSTEDQYQYNKKPEIKHLFREPEKRPPTVVSNLFTALLIVPVIILFGLWLKIGVNISNFPFTVSAVGFHVGLTAIFGLYTCYFLKLNMFTTLRYLGIIGIPTFLFGQKLLSLIAARSSRKH